MNISFLLRKLPTQKRSKRMITAILRAAGKVLIRDGYESFTTNHVADEAKISVGSIYQYFPDKQTLVGYMLSEQVQQIKDEVIKAMMARNSSITLRNFTAALFQRQLDRFIDEADLIKAMFPLIEELGLLALLEEDLVRASDVFLETHNIKVKQPRRSYAVRLCIQCILDQLNRFALDPVQALSSQQLAEMLAELTLEFLVDDPDLQLQFRSETFSK